MGEYGSGEGVKTWSVGECCCLWASQAGLDGLWPSGDAGGG